MADELFLDGDSHFEIRDDGGLEMLRFVDDMQEAVSFLANSWWRRTLINLAGGGRLVITKPPASVEED